MSHPDVRPNSFVHLSVEWQYISNMSSEKGFCKEHPNVPCLQDQNDLQRQQLLNTAACRRPPAAFPVLSGLLSKRAAPMASPQTRLLADKRCVSAAQNDRIHTVSNGLHETFGHTVQVFLFLTEELFQ